MEDRLAARILLTGVAGYLGAHVAVALAQAGFEVIGLDRQPASQCPGIGRLQHLCGDQLRVDRVDLREPAEVLRALSRHRPAAVIHCALLGPGMSSPLAYYDNNVHGLTTLLAAMTAVGPRTLVMTSSSAIYGKPLLPTVTERSLTAPVNAYGRSLAACENLLADQRAADARWRFGVLRVFQPLGAHDSGLIGDYAAGADDLLAQAFDTVDGRFERVSLNGGNWPTRDGTRVCDIVHVTDVTRGVLRALEALARGIGSFTVNLGSGRGCSELQLLATVERVLRRPVPFDLGSERAGIAEIIADCRRAKTLLDWSAQSSIDQMCADAWRARRFARRGLNAPESMTLRSTPGSPTASWHGS
jgi:UDP-glucose 4-epimerase